MQSVIRITTLLILFGGAAFVWFKHPEVVRALINDPRISQAINFAGGKVQGAATSLNIDPAIITNRLTTKIQDNASTNTNIDQLTSQITSNLKNIPKNQAKEIVTNVCNQIISNIDKQ